MKGGPPLALVLIGAMLLSGCSSPSPQVSTGDSHPDPQFSWTTLYFNGTVGPTACAVSCFTGDPLDEHAINKTDLVVRHVRLHLEWDPPLVLCDKMRLQLDHELHFPTYGFGTPLLYVWGSGPLEATVDNLAVPLNDTSRLGIAVGPKGSFVNAYAQVGLWASLEIPYRLSVEIEARPLVPDDAGLLDDFEQEALPPPPDSAVNPTLC